VSPFNPEEGLTTMDLYVHSYDEDLRAAVGKLGAAIG
jgi:hypothetical protein